MMGQVEVNAGDIRRFVATVETQTGVIGELSAELVSAVSRLGDSWHDRNYREFADALADAQTSLTRFGEQSRSFAQYLRNCLAPIEEYLAIRVPGEVGERAARAEQARRNQFDAQVNAALAAVRPLVARTVDEWPRLRRHERLERIQEIEIRIAAVQGRAPQPIIPKRMRPGEFGAFDPELQRIEINADHVDNPRPAEEGREHCWDALDTILHEGRHAYQDWAVRHPGFHPDEAQVAAWAENQRPGNYIRSATVRPELYRGQPLEADAFAFGESLALELMKEWAYGRNR